MAGHQKFNEFSQYPLHHASRQVPKQSNELAPYLTTKEVTSKEDGEVQLELMYMPGAASACFCKKTRKDPKEFGGASEREIASKWHQFVVLIGGANADIGNPAQLVEALNMMLELLRVQQRHAISALVSAVCNICNLAALEHVLVHLDHPLGNGSTGRDLVDLAVYQRTSDAICLAPDPEFQTQGLDLLLRLHFAPSVDLLMSPDARDYFVRMNHFLNLEMAAEIKQNSKRVASIADAIPTATDEPSWEIHLKAREVWHHRTQNQIRQDGRGEPVPGDILLIQEQERKQTTTGVVVGQVPNKGQATPFVVIDNPHVLQRYRSMEVHVVLATSKTPVDRQRAAVYEICKRSTQCPAMQKWILTKPCRPMSCTANLPDLPADGQTRLWVSLYDQTEDKTSIDAMGAEWCDQLRPGMRRGLLFFEPDNPQGEKPFGFEATGCIVLMRISEKLSFSEQVRNAASAGAIGAVIANEAGPLRKMEADNKPITLPIPAGAVAGLKFKSRDNGTNSVIVVSEIKQGSVVAHLVREGTVLEAIDSQKSEAGPTLDEAELHLPFDELTPVALYARFRPDVEKPSIPAVLVHKRDGELLKDSIGPQCETEIHVADKPPEWIPEQPVSEGELNESQLQAVKLALSPSRKTKSGSVTLIQGPPGTGKTTTALSIIANWLAEDDWDHSVDENGQEFWYNRHTEKSAFQQPKPRRILVTGFSNIAVDNIAIGLQDRGLGPLIRVGKGQTVLNRDTIQQRMACREEAEQLSKLKEVSAERDKFARMERKMMREEIEKARVTAVTCISSGSENLQGFQFPLVLVDEAAQSAEPATLVPLARSCEELVMIGDQKQLPPTVFADIGWAKGLAESLFERFIRCDAPRTLLTTQYRMHPAIVAFPSLTFYGNRLANGVQAEGRLSPSGFRWPRPNKPLCFVGVGSPDSKLEESVGTSWANQTEAFQLVETCQALLSAGDIPAEEIAVISPYAAQVGVLRGSLRKWGITVDTVDAFQGMERDCIVVSTVRSSGASRDSRASRIGFLSDRRRFNVLLTRAKRGLIVFGHQATLLSDPVWGDWITHCVEEHMVMGDVRAGLPCAMHDNLRLDRKTIQMFGGPGTWMDFAGDLWPKTNQPKETTIEQRINAANKQADANRTILLSNPNVEFEQGQLPIEFDMEGPGHKRVWVAKLTLTLPGTSPVAVTGKAPMKKDAENLCLKSSVDYLRGVEHSLDPIGEPPLKKQATESQVLEVAVEAAKPAQVPGAQVGMFPAAKPLPPVETVNKATLGENKQFLVRSGVFGKGNALQLIQTHDGPQHQRIFTCQLKVPLATVLVATGKAKTKKEAEIQCIEAAVDILEKNGFTNSLKGIGTLAGGGFAKKGKKRAQEFESSAAVDEALKNSEAQARLFASFARMDQFSEGTEPEPPKVIAPPPHIQRPEAAKPKVSSVAASATPKAPGRVSMQNPTTLLPAPKQASKQAAQPSSAMDDELPSDLEAAKEAAMAKLKELADLLG